MKTVTEFPNFTLNKALATRAALTAEGKTPEEIQASLGETYKLEGDKLKYFTYALDVAAQNTEQLKRVVIMTLNEGETAPAKSQQFEDHHYLAEFFNLTPYKAPAKTDGKNRGPRKGGGNDKKSSPWGLSPEEKANKNKGGANKAAAKA